MDDRQRFFRTPQELLRAAINSVFRHEKAQVPKRQTRYDYTQGPMYYLGQQIVKHMQDAGYPAKILYCHRSADKQRELYSKGRTTPGRIVTKAGPWESAHQYYEAVDIIHPSKGWEVSEKYWDTLATVVRIVSDKYGVQLNHGHNWRFRDSAHIETPDWRRVRDRHRQTIAFEGEERPPNGQELWNRFFEVLPDVAKRLVADRRAPKGVETPPAYLPKPRKR
ncbi:M15 family metallopeptidase [Pseudophaeobacter arcticus]|uniref:M15 family metallopeptidase n=1 Tax=Pseudophaeobacter arcticus TaxID=385492 RepID=UPI002490CD4E|nr:M15 family metallopeptidase [Pseudophaeobacter arcticus]